MLNFKDFLEDETITEVSLDRKYNDKEIKSSVKAIERIMAKMQKRLDALKVNDYNDEAANKFRGDLTAWFNRFSGLDSYLPAIYAKDKKKV